MAAFALQPPVAAFALQPPAAGSALHTALTSATSVRRAKFFADSQGQALATAGKRSRGAASVLPLFAASVALLRTAPRRRALTLRRQCVVEQAGVVELVGLRRPRDPHEPAAVEELVGAGAERGRQEAGSRAGGGRERPPPQGGPASSEDLQEICRRAGLSLEQLKDIIRYAYMQFDENGDGIISAEEFCAACGMLSLKIELQTQHKLFALISKGKNAISLEDVKDSFDQDVIGRLLANATEWYEASPLCKCAHISSRLWEALTDGQLPLDERLHSAKQTLESDAEVIAEIMEFGIATSLLVNKLQCFPECQDVDWTDLVPPVMMLARSAAQTSRLLADRSTTDLDEEDAAIFATVFKAAGCTVGSFQSLAEKTGARWVSLPAGTRMPAAVFDRALGLIGRGRIKIENQWKAMAAMSGTDLEFGPGSFLGSHSGTGAAKTFWSRSKQYVKVVEDVRLLCWETDGLREFLSSHEDERQAFQRAFSQSTLRTINLLGQQASAISKELPYFFRDMLLRMSEQYEADRASVWIHDSKRNILWTLFVKDDGSSTYFEMDDKHGLAGHALSSKTTINIKDCYSDARFNTQADKSTGYVTKSMLCVPVVSEDDREKPIGVIQLLNRLSTTEGPDGEPRTSAAQFTSADEEKAQDIMWQAALMIKTLARRYNASHVPSNPDGR